jgi:hypothetical protein
LPVSWSCTDADRVDRRDASSTDGRRPEAFAAVGKHARKESDQYAVMTDVRYPPAVASLPKGVENRGYAGFVESEVGIAIALRSLAYHQPVRRPFSLSGVR